MKIDRRRPKSRFTAISFYLSILAAITLIILGVSHINDQTVYGSTFGKISLIEGILALGSILAIDFIYTGQFINPKNFQRLDFSIIFNTAIILGGLVFIQLFIVQIGKPQTVRDAEMYAAIAFAAPAEELFFRGLLLGSLMQITKFLPKKFRFRLGKKEFSIIDFLSVPLQAVLFMALHVNYYGDMQYMLITFLSGLWLGIAYLYWEDLTANILAHFTLNIVVVGKLFWQVNALALLGGI
jgi:membrane protease YdiL (CAAX protease family)